MATVSIGWWTLICDLLKLSATCFSTANPFLSAAYKEHKVRQLHFTSSIESSQAGGACNTSQGKLHRPTHPYPSIPSPRCSQCALGIRASSIQRGSFAALTKNPKQTPCHTQMSYSLHAKYPTHTITRTIPFKEFQP